VSLFQLVMTQEWHEGAERERQRYGTASHRPPSHYATKTALGTFETAYETGVRLSLQAGVNNPIPGISKTAGLDTAGSD
jgi:hypothetical protein